MVARSAEHGEATDHAAADAVDHPAAGVADQQRQQVGDARVRPAWRSSAFGVQPHRDEERGDQAPGDDAPMLGMIMFDKNVPNFWTWTRTQVRVAGGAVAWPCWSFLKSADPSVRSETG